MPSVALPDSQNSKSWRMTHVELLAIGTVIGHSEFLKLPHVSFPK